MDLGDLFKPKDGKNQKKSIVETSGAIPVLNQATNAVGGATNAFSGIGRHVNTSLKKIGAKHVKTGIGSGVGFGAGLALKPGVVHQFQLYLVQTVEKMMSKVGVSQTYGQPILPPSMLSRTSMVNQKPPFDPTLNMMQYLGVDSFPRLLGNKNVSKGFSSESMQSDIVVADSSFSSRTEKVIGRFLQNPALQENSALNEIDGRQLQSESRMLHMVLKHEQIIGELLEENKKLRQILVEDLKVSPHKFHKHSSKSKSGCSECVEHHKKHRRR